MIRRAAVAGSFYAGTRERLRFQLRDLVETDQKKERVIGVVAPHAGYMYSGKVAGAVYSRITFPEVFVILSPNHTGLGAGAAIMTYGEWETPLGAVPIDSALAQTILTHSQTLEEDHLAHLKEHSLEVQLPFLQYFGQPFSFVPICLFSHEYAACQDVGQAVAAAIQESGRSVTVVASTDMSHYVPQQVAEEKDRRAIDAILTLDPPGLHQTVLKNRISMCGFHPTTAMLIAAKALGAQSAELVKYMTSGDVTKDYDQVVAYAGLLIK